MSIRNEDRHGIANLTHERVKLMDKLHIPPWLIFGFVVVPMMWFLHNQYRSTSDTAEIISRRNLLLAAKKTQQMMEYGEDEVSGSEELAIQSTQFKQVVEEKRARE